MKNILTIILCCLSACYVRADEGMWMLNKIDQKTADVISELGLELTPSQLYNPEGVSLKDAVVNFGDFCSGVVVSPNGLLFTNHHCGYGAIQALSTPEDDILANGFVAKNLQEERPAEGLFVRFLQRTEDCTSRIMMALDTLYKQNPTQPTSQLFTQKIDSICQAVETEFRVANPQFDCMLKSYYGGNAFYVSFYKTYTDIRLVFTATETLGKFGGDTDNWMWPRQTCDFSMFRIYADKNGEPAAYSTENVPLKVKRYAQVSIDGYRAGDYCMTIGYPGSTSRYLSSWGISERMEAQNVPMIQVRGTKQEIWKKWMDADRAIGIKYASKFASSSNYWKNSIGMNKAITDLDVIGQKQTIEQNIMKWYQGREDLQRRFGDMFDNLKNAYASRKESTHAMYYFYESFFSGMEIVKFANRMSLLPKEASEQDIADARDYATRFFKNYDARVDQECMGVLLENYRKHVDAKYLPACYQTIDKDFNGDCTAFAKDLFAKTICTNPNCIDSLQANKKLYDTDPAILFAKSAYSMRSIIAQSSHASQTIFYNEHLLTQALLEMNQENPYYSDANFSMRLSYGYIQDYTANGTKYDYYTNAKSLIDKAEKQDEIEDYKLESSIVDLLKSNKFGRYTDKNTGEMQLCFISNNDITGGNSGSPMFNGKGELIGLAFDGNWEAMSGDISFNSNLQRCIGVDIRYVLFLIDKWGKAPYLIKEMGL